MKKRDALPPTLAPRLVNLAAAAAYCGVSAGTFEDKIAPEVPPLTKKLAAGRLWDLRDIDAWIERQKHHIGKSVEPFEWRLGKP